VILILDFDDGWGREWDMLMMGAAPLWSGNLSVSKYKDGKETGIQADF